MAEPIEFPGQNTVWYGLGDVDPLPVNLDPRTDQNVSCWRLNEMELEEIARTAHVWLYVWGQHPAVFVGGHKPFEEDAQAPQG